MNKCEIYIFLDQARRSAHGRGKTDNIRVQTYFQLNEIDEHSLHHIAELIDLTNKHGR